jgi:hypothetical protein
MMYGSVGSFFYAIVGSIDGVFFSLRRCFENVTPFDQLASA